jgi:hypothetical protein
MKKVMKILLVISLLALNIIQFFIYNYSHNLPIDVVPNEEVAIQIAETVLIPIYGEDVLFNRPFKVINDKSMKSWIVIGTLPEGYLGDVPEIIIRKKDGRIMKISYGF